MDLQELHQLLTAYPRLMAGISILTIVLWACVGYCSKFTSNWHTPTRKMHASVLVCDILLLGSMAYAISINLPDSSSFFDWLLVVLSYVPCIVLSLSLLYNLRGTFCSKYAYAADHADRELLTFGVIVSPLLILGWYGLIG